MPSEWPTPAQLTQRILPRLRAAFSDAPATNGRPSKLASQKHFERLFGLLHHLYGGRYDFFYHLEQILETACRLALARPADLKALDAAREADPAWFQSQKMLGGVCYVDLFAGNLAGLRGEAPLLQGTGPDLPAPDAALQGARRARTTAATRSAPTARSTRRWGPWPSCPTWHASCASRASA